MRNKIRQHRDNDRTRRVGKWLGIGLLLVTVVGGGKRVGNGRRRLRRALRGRVSS